MPDPVPSAPVISIVVRSHNDEALIERTLTMLRDQTRRDTEIISIDDHSTDRTPEIIARFPEVRRIASPPGPYFPGRVLNTAVRACRGNIVVFNNSDSIPLSRDWLARLVAPIESGEAEAVYANQYCRPDAEILVRKDHERAFGDGTEAARWTFFFSLVSSAARRSDLTEYPFNEALRCSEDVDWAWRLQQRGGRIRYVADAHVEHSHNYNWRGLWRRFYLEGCDYRVIYGKPVPFVTALRQFAAETLRDEWYLLKHGRPDRALVPPVRRFIQKFARYHGSRNAS